MEKPLLLFDFDGVLVDSFDINQQVFNEFYPQMTQDEILSLYDGNGITRLREFQERNGYTDILERQTAFSVRYSELAATKSLSDWAAAMLQQLAERFTLTIVTTSREEGVEACLMRSGARGHVARIYGRNAHDSKVEKIRMAFADHGGVPERSLFVTDTVGDVHEAREAGVHALAVAWGFHPRERLAKGNPWAIVDSPAHLTTMIDTYFYDAVRTD